MSHRRRPELSRIAAVLRVAPCVVCFSSADPLVRSGVNAGVLVLLGITVVVLAGFAAFILRLALRNPDSAVPAETSTPG